MTKYRKTMYPKTRRKNIVHKIILKMESLNKETYKYLKSTESRISHKVALRYWRWKDGKMEHLILNHNVKSLQVDKIGKCRHVSIEEIKSRYCCL